MDTVVTSALMYAMEKHAGQVYSRKDEDWPFITHPIRVALRVAGLSYDRTTLIVALLHDVVEDTDATIGDVRFRFGIVVSSAISCLTRKEGVSYKNYIRSIVGHPIAQLVKVADLQDNLYHCRINSTPEFTKSLIGRYVWALEHLTGTKCDNCGASASYCETEEDAIEAWNKRHLSI